MEKLGVFILFVLLAFSSTAFATDIQLAWEAPTHHEDGTTITQIDRYYLYYVVNNAVQDTIEIEASSVDHTLVDVAAGAYTFQISTVSNGIESERSEPVSVTVSDSKPVKIELTVRVIE